MRTRLTVIGAAVVLLAVIVLVAWLARPWEDELWGDEPTLGAAEAVRTLSGDDEDPLKRPVGVLVHEARIYVADSLRGVIDVLSPGGHHYTSWGRGALTNPVAVARHPLTGDFYVADRGADAVVVFGPDGSLRGRFAPRVPQRRSWAETETALWSPAGLDFTRDGYLFVTDVRSRHRLLAFGPDGEFEFEAGLDASTGEPIPAARLSYPTDVDVHGNEVRVADSNNMRVQVFDVSGRHLRAIPLKGLPRGVAVTPEGEDAALMLVVDATGHRVAVLDPAAGSVLGEFAKNGSAEDCLSYPNAVATGEGDLIFVADTGNARVAVWRWLGLDGDAEPGAWWWLLALPFAPLIALPWALAKPRYHVTADFILALEALGRVEEFTHARARWECVSGEYALLEQHQDEGGPIVTTLRRVEASPSDSAAFVARYQLDEREAEVLAALRGSVTLLTEDRAIARVAEKIALRVEDAEAFLARVDREREAAR